METIPNHLLAKPITGVNLRGNTLGQEIGEWETLLVFLRHFGCIFCRELVRDIRDYHYSQAGFVPVIFFYQEIPEEGVRFFNKYWSEARGISDQERDFYSTFGLGRGTVNQVVGPESMVCGIRATLKGNFMGKPTADVWEMPGMFLVKNRMIMWKHHYRHAGDHPDLSKFPRMMPA